eukprot:8542462-Lingulodinium_polyedra.AAC.1
MTSQRSGGQTLLDGLKSGAAATSSHGRREHQWSWIFRQKPGIGYHSWQTPIAIPIGRRHQGRQG